MIPAIVNLELLILDIQALHKLPRPLEIAYTIRSSMRYPQPRDSILTRILPYFDLTFFQRGCPIQHPRQPLQSTCIVAELILHILLLHLRVSTQQLLVNDVYHLSVRKQLPCQSTYNYSYLGGP